MTDLMNVATSYAYGEEAWVDKQKTMTTPTHRSDLETFKAEVSMVVPDNNKVYKMTTATSLIVTGSAKTTSTAATRSTTSSEASASAVSAQRGASGRLRRSKVVLTLTRSWICHATTTRPKTPVSPGPTTPTGNAPGTSERCAGGRGATRRKVTTTTTGLTQTEMVRVETQAVAVAESARMPT